MWNKYWLETPNSTNNARCWVLNVQNRSIVNNATNNAGYGVRPAIDTSKSKLNLNKG